MMKVIRYAKRLISFESTSHLSNLKISRYLEAKLTKHGFVIEKVSYKDPNGVQKVNLLAKKGGGVGGLAFFAHTDTVPADDWHDDSVSPFEGIESRDRLYGRGSCDMKGPIACVLTAVQKFDWDALKQPLYLVFTADEELGYEGAQEVVTKSEFYREMVKDGTKGVISEPTLLEVVYAHKGSVRVWAESEGKMGHSSLTTSQSATWKLIPFLTKMKTLRDETEADVKWQNQLFDPPSMTWNIQVEDNSPAINVTAGKASCSIFFRPMKGIEMEPLLARIKEAAEAFDVKLEIENQGTGMLTDPDTEFVQQSLKLLHRHQAKTVSYGTDGGVFDEIKEKIVCGPGSIAQAHTVDEWISLEQLKLGTEMFTKMIRHWCCNTSEFESENSCDG